MVRRGDAADDRAAHTYLGFVELRTGEEQGVVEGNRGQAAVEEAHRLLHHLAWLDCTQFHYLAAGLHDCDLWIREEEPICE